MNHKNQALALRILLIEDNEHDCLVFRRAMAQDNPQHQITECIRGEDALSKLQSKPQQFDIVVVDHQLPGMSGLELYKTLLSGEKPIPVVLMTGCGSEQLAVEALKLGVDDYIVKSADHAHMELLPLVLRDTYQLHQDRIAREDAESAQRQSEYLLTQIVERSSVPTFVINKDHIVTHWNLACARLTDFSSQQAIGSNEQWRAFYDSERPVMADLMVDKVLDDTVAEFYPDKHHRSELIEGAYEGEDFFPALGESGKWLFFTAAPMRDEQGQVIGSIETLQDITEAKQAEQALRDSEQRFRELSITDGLTGLFNSRHFFHQVTQEVNRSTRHQHPLSILMIDVDHFKRFNDNYGHQEGDTVLSKLGKIIPACLRGSDSGFRYGGEEFAVILPETPGDTAHVVAERLREMLAELTFTPTPNIDEQITISIGIAQFKAGEKSQHFIKRADDNLYQAKAAGRNRVHYS